MQHLYPFEDICEKLGGLTVEQLKYRVRKDKIPFVKFGHRSYLTQESFDKLVSMNTMTFSDGD